MTPESAMFEILGQLPIVMVLYFWLKAERDDRKADQAYYRNREEVWFGLMATFIREKLEDTQEFPAVNVKTDKPN